MTRLLQLQLVLAALLTGVIVFAQVAHYPLFALVGAAEAPAFVTAHVERARWVVTAPIVLELGVAVALVLSRRTRVPLAWRLLGLALALVIGVVSVFVHVPLYAVLRDHFDAHAHATLVSTNWIRTICWSARLVLAWAMLDRHGRYSDCAKRLAPACGSLER